MTIEPLKLVSSRTLVLTSNNIDTDQIMPAKFLSMTTQNGLGVHVFSNLRYTDDGTLTDHELNSVSGKHVKYLLRETILVVVHHVNMLRGDLLIMDFV